MFKNCQHIYNANEMTIFDTKYRSDKIGFSPSFQIINKLIKSSILKEHGYSYSFTHKYLYNYYFVAYNFSKNINKDEYTDEITRMVKLVYMNGPANILMFIVPFIPPESIIQILLMTPLIS